MDDNELGRGGNEGYRGGVKQIGLLLWSKGNGLEFLVTEEGTFTHKKRNFR